MKTTSAVLVLVSVFLPWCSNAAVGWFPARPFDEPGAGGQILRSIAPIENGQILAVGELDDGSATAGRFIGGTEAGWNFQPLTIPAGASNPTAYGLGIDGSVLFGTATYPITGTEQCQLVTQFTRWLQWSRDEYSGQLALIPAFHERYDRIVVSNANQQSLVGSLSSYCRDEVLPFRLTGAHFTNLALVAPYTDGYASSISRDGWTVGTLGDGVLIQEDMSWITSRSRAVVWTPANHLILLTNFGMQRVSACSISPNGEHILGKAETQIVVWNQTTNGLWEDTRFLSDSDPIDLEYPIKVTDSGYVVGYHDNEGLSTDGFIISPDGQRTAGKDFLALYGVDLDYVDSIDDAVEANGLLYLLIRGYPFHGVLVIDPSVPPSDLFFKLSIAPAAGGVRLSWPAKYSDAVVEGTTALGGQWNPVTGSRTTQDGVISMQVNASGQGRFFRLAR